MKTIIILTFVLFTITVSGQTENGSEVFKYHRPVITDLNNDNVVDSIFISSSIKENQSFNKITISITGLSKQTFIAKNSWTEVDSAFLASNKNSIASKDIFVLKAKDHSVILLFGYLDGAGYRVDFSIINIKDNNSKMVFDRGENDIDVEIPMKLTDLDNDGRTDFVFRNLYELYQAVDSLNADIGSYSPYLVYTINNDCKLNEPLTKKYNEENFVFAGYEYSEEIKILFPRDGSKPRVIQQK